MDGISYKRGANALNGSLGGLSESALISGFDDVTPQKLDPLDASYQRQDDDGSNYVGDRWEFRKTGACGRPQGEER